MPHPTGDPPQPAAACRFPAPRVCLTADFQALGSALPIATPRSDSGLTSNKISELIFPNRGKTTILASSGVGERLPPWAHPTNYKSRACPPQPWRRRVTIHFFSTRHIPEVEFTATHTISRTSDFLLVTQSSDFAPGPSPHVAAAFRRAHFSFLLAVRKPRTHRDPSGRPISNRGSAIRNRRKPFAMNHFKISNRLKTGGSRRRISHVLGSECDEPPSQFTHKFRGAATRVTTHESPSFLPFVIASTLRVFSVESRHAPAHFA